MAKFHTPLTMPLDGNEWSAVHSDSVEKTLT